MYTGTLIQDLMATVERVERSAELKRRTEELELRRIYDLQISDSQSTAIFAGAA
jgi:hypothetical protein